MSKSVGGWLLWKLRRRATGLVVSFSMIDMFQLTVNSFIVYLISQYPTNQREGKAYHAIIPKHQ
jgi:hypothetical protein